MSGWSEVAKECKKRKRDARTGFLFWTGIGLILSTLLHYSKWIYVPYFVTWYCAGWSFMACCRHRKLEKRALAMEEYYLSKVDTSP